jgi:hypothetical protein
MKLNWESEGGGVVVVAGCEKSTMLMFMYLKTGHNLSVFTCLCIQNRFPCYSCRSINTNVGSKSVEDILDVFSKNLACHIQILSIARMHKHIDVPFL